MKCFYHSADLDGHCSGAIIKQAYPECEMIGVNYNNKLPYLENSENETIFVVDFSFTKKEMLWLNAHSNLIWIDHHKTAIDKMSGTNIKGLQLVGKAGCELTWEWLYPEKKLPLAVHLLGRYDVWDHADKATLPLQYGLRLYKSTLPGSAVWKWLLKSQNTSESTELYVQKIIEEGELLLTYEIIQNKKYAKACSFSALFLDYKVIAVNKAMTNSKLLDSVYCKDTHDFMVIYSHTGDTFKYSLYNVDDKGIDVAKIAEHFGGGGHKNAAGFYYKDFILTKI